MEIKHMAQSYENLEIWKDSLNLAEEVYSITRKFPKEEMFGMISQLRRAVVSISSNIAEGSSRGSAKDYCRFIDISIGSLKEVESLCHLSLRLGYISSGVATDLFNKFDKLGKSMGGFRKYLIK